MLNSLVFKTTRVTKYSNYPNDSLTIIISKKPNQISVMRQWPNWLNIWRELSYRMSRESVIFNFSDLAGVIVANLAIQVKSTTQLDYSKMLLSVMLFERGLLIRVAGQVC